MNKPNNFDYDLIVIGSGAAGSAAASIVVNAKKRVAIVEADQFGGDLANYSDVPVDAILHTTNIYNQARKGSEFGIRSNSISFNYPSVHAWKDYVIKRTGAGGSKKYYTEQGIATYHGLARFITPNEITVNRRHLSAAKFLIATGSSWQKPPIHGLDLVDYLTPRTIFSNLRQPKNLAIIGGGKTGVELAQIMANLGTKVVLIEKSPNLLPDYDAEVGVTLEKSLHKSLGINTLSNSEVVSVLKEANQKKIIIRRGGVNKSILADSVLVACGQTPNTDIGLENATIKYSKNGVLVNKYLQTNAHHIYAAGNVVSGSHQEAPSALLESKVVAHNILKVDQMSPDYVGMPKIVSGYPSVAHVGLTEQDCKKKRMNVKITTAPLAIIAKSNTSNFYDGFIKLITNRRGLIVGASIVSPSANEMIHELALAIRYGLTTEQLASTPHAFLSWSELIRVASTKSL